MIQQNILIKINLLGPYLSAAFPKTYPPIMEITIANARMFWLSAGVSPASSTKYTASKPLMRVLIASA